MGMSIEEINRYCSKLTEDQIMALPDEQILELTVERPGHPGQFGFMLSLEYFDSQQHLSKTMTALMLRLAKVHKKS